MLEILFSGGVFKGGKVQTGIIFQVFSNPNRKYENQAQFSAVKEKVYLFKFLFPKKVSFPIGSEKIINEAFKEKDEEYKRWEAEMKKSSKRPVSDRSYPDESPSEQQYGSGLKSARPQLQNGPSQIPSLKLALKNVKDYDSVEYKFEIGRQVENPRTKERETINMDDDSDVPSSHSSRGRKSSEYINRPKLELHNKSSNDGFKNQHAELPFKKLAIPKLGSGNGPLPSLNLGRLGLPKLA